MCHRSYESNLSVSSYGSTLCLYIFVYGLCVPMCLVCAKGVNVVYLVDVCLHTDVVFLSCLSVNLQCVYLWIYSVCVCTCV